MDLLLRPARHAAQVTPSDTVDLPRKAIKGLYVGTAGAIKVTTDGGSVVTLPNVPVGLLSLSVSRVWATGTTAAGIMAFY